MSHTVVHTVVTLKAMRFHAFVGILPHEKEIAQPIEVDISVDVATGAADRAKSHIVDYTHLYAVASASVTSKHTEYLEEIADRIATSALRIDHVATARVAVRKPHVTLGGPLAYAEVSITRTRDA